MFSNPEKSHAHSLETLNQLYEYDDFMLSIANLVDMGCGAGLDLEWWATRTTRDEIPEPLNIKCLGVDTVNHVNSVARKYSNITFQENNFEHEIYLNNNSKFDIIWSHDSFQYCVNPLQTLRNWKSIANDSAMMILILPQTTNIVQRQLEILQANGNYFHYTLVNLIHMLAVTGWDCKQGFFKKSFTDPWLYAAVYNSEHSAMDPATTTWYELAEKQLLPDSVEQSVKRHGHVISQDLVLPWIDKSLTWYGKQ